MLTKQIALERLRATGTLATGKAPDDTLDPGAVGCPVARRLDVLMRSNQRVSNPRHVAPSMNHAVLP